MPTWASSASSSRGSPDPPVRRMWAFFAALPPGEFPDTVELAALLARISTEDQFQFGIRTFLAGLNAQSKLKANTPTGTAASLAGLRRHASGRAAPAGR
jgi:hypothetical protein